MRKVAPLLLGLALCLTSGAALSFSTEYNQGKRAYDRGDYAAALSYWDGPANAGDVDAQAGLAEMYEYGYGVEQDSKRAEFWFLKAAISGNTQSQLKLGLLYSSAKASGKALEGYKWLRIASDDPGPIGSNAKFFLKTFSQWLSEEERAEGARLAREFKSQLKTQDAQAEDGQKAQADIAVTQQAAPAAATESPPNLAPSSGVPGDSVSDDHEITGPVARARQSAAPENTGRSEPSQQTGAAPSNVRQSQVEGPNEGLKVVRASETPSEGGSVPGETPNGRIMLGAELSRHGKNVSAECIRLKVQESGGRTSFVSGRVDKQSRKAKIRKFHAPMPKAAKIRFFLNTVERPYCNVLDLHDWIEDHLNRGGPVSFKLSNHGGVYSRGEFVVIALEGSPTSKHVYVDYFTSDGRVAHLSPNLVQDKLPLRSGQMMRIGDGILEAVPPYGRELISVIISTHPLFPKIRPTVESTIKYLDQLNGALFQAHRAEMQVAAGHAFVITQK